MTESWTSIPPFDQKGMSDSCSGHFQVQGGTTLHRHGWRLFLHLGVFQPSIDPLKPLPCGIWERSLLDSLTFSRNDSAGTAAIPSFQVSFPSPRRPMNIGNQRGPSMALGCELTVTDNRIVGVLDSRRYSHAKSVLTTQRSLGTLILVNE